MSNSSIQNEIRFSVELDAKIDAYYAEFSTNPSTEQKIRILENVVGKSQYYSNDGNVSQETMLACLEHEWLMLHELIELELA